MADATLKDIARFFEMTSAEFAKEWKRLDDGEKDYFKRAVGETLTSDK